MPKKFDNNNLTPNQPVFIRGKIDFARVSRLIEGAELDKHIAQTNYPTEVPHSSLTVKNVSIFPASGNDNDLNYNESYIQERFYDSKKNPDKSPLYSAVRKKSLPYIFEKNDDGTYDQIVRPEGELDRDLDVIVQIDVREFSANNKPAVKGTSLGAIYIEGPVRYYSPIDTQALQNRGIVLSDSQVKPTVSAAQTNDNNNDTSESQNQSQQTQPQMGMPTAAGTTADAQSAGVNMQAQPQFTQAPQFSGGQNQQPQQPQFAQQPQQPQQGYQQNPQPQAPQAGSDNYDPWNDDPWNGQPQQAPQNQQPQAQQPQQPTPPTTQSPWDTGISYTE